MARTHPERPKVRFYQLAALSLEKALVGIVSKAWDRGLRLCLLAQNPPHAHWLDGFLWQCSNDLFLPHGLWDHPDPERQPILISLEPDDRNGATVIITTTHRQISDPEQFDMIIDFIQGQDPDALTASRTRYRHYRSLGCVMEYWTQSPQGGWQKNPG